MSNHYTSNHYPSGTWVLQTHGKLKGRVGIIHTVWAGRATLIPRYTVKFGADGPFVRLSHGSLAPATPEQIARKTGALP